VANAPPPRNQMVRLGYARALVANHQWRDAVPEFEMLAANQIEYTRSDIADLADQARAGGATRAVQQSIDTLKVSAAGPRRASLSRSTDLGEHSIKRGDHHRTLKSGSGRAPVVAFLANGAGLEQSWACCGYRNRVSTLVDYVSLLRCFDSGAHCCDTSGLNKP
jgi:hypothetical protein